MTSDYERIERAIIYIQDNLKQQPELDNIAGHIGLSPFHFQRLFQRWAGISPKRYLEFLTVQKAKSQLLQEDSILDTALDTGLSGPGRLHDHFVAIDAVSPGEFKSGGEGVVISYAYHTSPFGELFIATTNRGIMALSFLDNQVEGTELQDLKTDWPQAEFREDAKDSEEVVQRIFNAVKNKEKVLSLNIRGTNFQIRVWNALLKIPVGSVVSYQDVAQDIGSPRAVRAVASAIAANPVAFLIPCHRVLRKNGALGGYRWGLERKQVMLAWEQARTSLESQAK